MSGEREVVIAGSLELGFYRQGDGVVVYLNDSGTCRLRQRVRLRTDSEAMSGLRSRLLEWLANRVRLGGIAK